MADAILGTSTTLTGLDGEIEVEIKPGTQSADVITVKDRGITRLRGTGRGDLKIGVQVVTPTKLSHKERELIEKFASGRRSPAPELSHFQQGLFGKLRDRFLNF
jgi:molecular chaperone DnaJ